MSLGSVSEILWKERRLLERLRAHLAGPALVRSGAPGRAGESALEIELVKLELQRAELDRAVAVHRIAQDLGVLSPPTLLELAAAAPAPWDVILTDHRTALRADAAEAPEGVVPQSLRDSLA